VKASGEPELRALAIAALGLSEADEAAEALKELVKDPLLEGDVAAALARSPNPRSPAIIESWLRSEAWRRLGARAYTLRALTRGEETAWGRSALLVLAASTDRRDRAVGLAALVLLGKRDAVAALRDPDPAVRRAVATAAMADPRPATEAALLDLSRHEPDLLVQKVERAALVSGDPEGRVSTVLLAERATAGESDGPLCTMALAARRDPDYQAKVEAFFASTDPIVRAHAARGLGYSEDAGATGLLAHGFGFEVDTLVRRAIVLALARRTQDKGAPARQFVLKKAARLDPDRTVRDVAARALAGLPPEARAAERMEFAWLRLATAAGHSPGEIRGSTKYVGGRPQTGEVGGLLLRSDGIAVPIAFDPEGYALVPIPPGEARLLLEPRIPVYEQPRHE